MEFIKKHYEKLILLLLLVIFIASMFHVLTIVKQTGEIQEHHLQIPTRDPDYKIHSPDDPIFDVTELLKSTSLNWINPGPRNPDNADHYSDLAHVFPIVRCPFCGKLIPRSYMEKEQVCPFCRNHDNKGANFVKPPDDVIVVVLPEEFLTRYGINANDPDAPYYDMDNDGFSTIYEYQKKTDPKDPRSRPPLWNRLRVIDVGKVTLPVRLMALNTLDNKDPKTWELQINNGKFSDLYMIGSELEIEHKFFRIVRAEHKVADAADEKGVKKDLSVIYLKEVDGDRELSMAVGQPVRSFADKAILEDSANPEKRLTLNVGDTFPLGNNLTGTESYRVKSFDPKEKTVLLENPAAFEGDTTKDKTGAVMLVTTFGQIPHQMKVRIPKVQEGFGPEGPYYPGMPGPGRPSRR